MGRYGGVLISEFSDDEAYAKCILSTGTLGLVTTQTLKPLTEAEYRKIIGAPF